MNKSFLINSLTLSILSTILLANNSLASDSAFIEPPMVKIAAGSFFMGSDRGRDDEKPVRSVSVPAFQMGKYEVTLAEFSKFVKDTNYKMPDNCYQHVLGGPREKLASWNDNVYTFSKFHPVVCLPQQAAIDYAKWLSTKTGKNYRLPTEAEWEYTVRGGTTTRHFFGEESDANKACQYANISEWYAKNKSASIFPGAYVNDVQQCSDNEATLSVVGLYQPNPFGVYDMVGNVMEYLSDCYVDNYENAPTDGSAVITKDCKRTVVRGGSWHWYPFSSSKRGGMSDNFLGALEGFRLVLDTNGEVKTQSTGTPSFVKELALAQNKVKAKHKANAAYPNKPVGLQVTSTNTQSVSISWQKNTESFLTGYKVYRQDPITNENIAISNVIKTNEFVDNSPLAHNARYSVVALNNKTESVKSDAVDSGVVTVHNIPSKIEGEAYSYSPKGIVKFSTKEADNDKIINSIDEGSASYVINVDKPGSYQISARMFHVTSTKQFDIWLGDIKLASPKFEGDGGWKTVNNITVNLPKGKHTLTINGEDARMAINWLDIKPS